MAIIVLQNNIYLLYLIIACIVARLLVWGIVLECKCNIELFRELNEPGDLPFKFCLACSILLDVTFLIIIVSLLVLYLLSLVL